MDNKERRSLIKSLALAGVCSLGGCVTDETASTPTPKANRIRITPQNPTVGTSVVFSASVNKTEIDGDLKNGLFYYWSFSDDLNIDGRGREVTHVFDESGRHLVRMLVVDGIVIQNHFDDHPSHPTSFDDITGVADDASNFKRISQPINISGLPEQRLSVETALLNIYLRAERRNVSADGTAILEFSAANLSQEKELNVQLLIEVPTGLSVKGTSFNQGTGQYLSDYSLSPGETKGESVKITSNEPGTFDITGRAIYRFEDGENNQESQNITVHYRE